MKKNWRKFTSAFKAKVAIDALKERDSLAALSARYKIVWWVLEDCCRG